ncbi:MAG TPA: universal stress protein [Thermoanaerobaculia bacterium]|nr:universal stress protein [Thermoanaerobaculia bacterium]HUM29750.1 universal stress protein [Thermoanaerobaculia bacterium]HXK67050.1 universal stress protein [Thermoanaerobaculia bacterium]
MLPIQTILWPTDFSSSSLGALEYAGDIAKSFQSRLVLVHVIPMLPMVTVPSGITSFDVVEFKDTLMVSRKEQLEGICKDKVPNGVTAECVVDYGYEVEGILKAAEKVDADLIIMSTHGVTGFRRWVSGSVTEKILRASTCPVLAIPIPSPSE